MVFFFQAEDGIRDRDVTGVQTCALPISAPVANVNLGLPQNSLTTGAATTKYKFLGRIPVDPMTGTKDWGLRSMQRSEERRVGKECSAGWERSHDAKRGRRRPKERR